MIDQDVEALKLSRENVFGYIDVLRKIHTYTLESTLKLEALIKFMFDEANNQQIMDFQFTLRLIDFESSLYQKKSFLNFANKKKRIK